MKPFLSVILCITLAALCLAACGGTQDGHTLYVRDDYARAQMTAAFLNADSGETLEVKMKQIGSGEGYTEFSCTASTTDYDRVILSSEGDSTEELAFNDYVSGWELSSRRWYPYTYGTESADPTYKRVSFDYENRMKDVLIWTPDDYDADAEQKYSVIYMTDGQNLFNPSSTSTGSWGVAESALAMASQSDYRFIIVGIENADGWRDDELTPDIGEVLSEDYEDGRGAYFSDFLVSTVMPYIEENYNVYTDRVHTSVCGSSSGGIESFYIAMEHPDLFGSVGALSPAFLLYSDGTWEDYLSEKDFSAGYPTVYLYCGNSGGDDLEQALYTGTVAMPATLSRIGYPEEQVVTKLYGDGSHREMYWRAVFPDYLKYAFPLSASIDTDT